MRLQNTITESIQDRLSEDDLNELRKGCMPFLKDVKTVSSKYWHFLFRGFSRDEGDFFYKKVRTDRRPLDTSWMWHKAMDHAFDQKFGMKVRSTGVFCKISSPTGYGIDKMIFPINKYSCVWSKYVADAYFDQPDRANLANAPEELYPEAIDAVDSYKSTNITAAVRTLPTTNEIIVMCKSYYAVDLKFRDQIDEWIKNEI